MSDNYSVHHFQRGPGGTVDGGVTIQVPDDGGGRPATASYFDYDVNFREPYGDLDYVGLNQTDPIIDVDMNSRTIRMLAKLSYIEIVNNKELYNDTFIDTDNMHNDTNATLHNGDTNFTDDVLIDRTLTVKLETLLQDKLTVIKETLLQDILTVAKETLLQDTLGVVKKAHLQDELEVDKPALFNSDVDVNGQLTSDDFYYNGGGTSSGRLNAYTQLQEEANLAANVKVDAIDARLIVAETKLADL